MTTGIYIPTVQSNLPSIALEPVPPIGRAVLKLARDKGLSIPHAAIVAQLAGIGERPAR